MILLDMKDRRPLYEQIIDRFEELIFRKILEPESKLPSVRALAIDLSINPNTIQRAYSELERLGYIHSIKGKGNFVSDVKHLLPARQTEFFITLDTVLERSKDVSLGADEVLLHVKDYYNKGETLHD